MKKLLILALLTLSACSTFHFENGPVLEDEETVIREKWHHLAINGLIEISPPLDIKYNCDTRQWDRVTVERSFLNGLATASSQYFSIYSPWTIVYACRESID